MPPRELPPAETKERMEQAFTGLDQFMEQNRDHPDFGRYEALATSAVHAFRRMDLALSAPGGLTQFQTIAEELQGTYRDMMLIRATVAYDRLKKNLGVAPGESIESVLTRKMEAAFAHHPETLESLRGDLTAVITRLSTNPKDLIDNNSEPAGYFYITDNRLVPFFHMLNKDMALLEKCQTIEDRTVQAFIHELMGGLETIHATDPEAEARESMRAKLETHTDWKPLRIALVGVTGLVSILGLSYTVIKGKELSAPTLAWIAATVLTARPDLLQSNTDRVLDEIRHADPTLIYELAKEKGWKGEKAAKAIDQLADARRDNAQLLETLSKGGRVENAQITELLGSSTTEAAELLLAMDPEERPNALRVFGRAMSDQCRECVRVTVRNA